jgi:hypothetical protein
MSLTASSDQRAGFWEKAWFVTAATVGLALLLTAWSAYVAFRSHAVDFYAYYLAASGFRQGLDMYTLPTSGWELLARTLRVPDYAPPYRYPPLLAVGVMPLLSLPPRWAAFVWITLSAGAAMGATALLASALRPARPGEESRRLLLAWGLLALFTPVLTTLYAGQANTFVLLTVALTLWAFKRERPAAAGLALALGTMIKVMPAVLIVYFAWRRQWRVVLGAVIGLAALSLLSIVVVGPATFLSYITHAVVQADPQVAGAYPPNQSLIGFFSRLLTAHAWGGSWADNPGLAWTLGRAVGLLVLALTFVLCRPGRPIRERVDVEVGLMVIATHLFPSVSWYHHLALLLVPTMVLLWRGLNGGGWRDWRVLWGVVCLVLLDVQGLFWHQLAGWTLLLSLGTYAMLLLWAALAWLQERGTTSRRERVTNEGAAHLQGLLPHSGWDREPRAGPGDGRSPPRFGCDRTGDSSGTRGG